MKKKGFICQCVEVSFSVTINGVRSTGHTISFPQGTTVATFNNTLDRLIAGIRNMQKREDFLETVIDARRAIDEQVDRLKEVETNFFQR